MLELNWLSNISHLSKTAVTIFSLVDVAINKQLKSDLIYYKDGEHETLNDADDQKLLVT